MKPYDFVVVGAGIVGLATAWNIAQRRPTCRLLVLEKENRVGAHQSGHNSGVLHTGIYYKPGSLRATNCRRGKLLMEHFCQTYSIPFERCGKVIVAVDEQERGRLQNIFERGQANGVQCELINAGRLKELEPHASGIAAIHVPEAGIVDFLQVCEKLATLLREQGHEIHFNTSVNGIRTEPGQVVVESNSGAIHAKQLVTCGGLWADRLIRMSGEKPIAPIVPFRGEYYDLKPEAHHLCRTLIYPVPDPAYPFLGVHFTKTIRGGVECGPNAVLAFARDGYSKLSLNPWDLFETLTYSGFIRMALKNWQTGLGEQWRSWNKTAFVTALQRLVPEIRAEHLVPAPSGVRAQALGPDGKLIDDFVIQKFGRIVHVGNAPSPAATASLSIGERIADELLLE